MVVIRSVVHGDAINSRQSQVPLHSGFLASSSSWWCCGGQDSAQDFLDRHQSARILPISGIKIIIMNIPIAL